MLVLGRPSVEDRPGGCGSLSVRGRSRQLAAVVVVITLSVAGCGGSTSKQAQPSAAPPSVAGSSGAASIPTRAQLLTNLLTATDFSGAAAKTFSGSDKSADDKPSADSGCAAIDGLTNSFAGSSARAGRNFSDDADHFSGEETIAVLPGQGGVAFTKLMSGIGSCHNVNSNGTKIALVTPPAPSIAGADGVVATQESAPGFTFNVLVAHFGDTFVELAYGGKGLSADQGLHTAGQLLQQAVTKARTVGSAPAPTSATLSPTATPTPAVSSGTGTSAAAGPQGLYGCTQLGTTNTGTITFNEADHSYTPDTGAPGSFGVASQSIAFVGGVLDKAAGTYQATTNTVTFSKNGTTLTCNPK
jgi:hypothetical protein